MPLSFSSGHKVAPYSVHVSVLKLVVKLSILGAQRGGVAAAAG